MLSLIQIYVFSLEFFHYKIAMWSKHISRWEQVELERCFCQLLLLQIFQYLSVKEISGSIPEILS